jgi:transcriptional regulator with XRE-family HTH domain
MEAKAFQDRVKDWRIAAGLNQVQLNEACGFPEDTVTEIEQGRKALTEEQLVAIVICTNRDLLPTLLESFGSLYKKLRPLEVTFRRRFDKGPPPPPPDETEEYRRGRDLLFSGADVLLKLLLRISDRQSFLAEILLDAAARDIKPKQSRVRKKGGTRKKTVKKTPASSPSS